MQNSAEVRFFWMDGAQRVEAWFQSGLIKAGGGPTREPRVDVYLLDPDQPELGIKKRGTKPGVEVKGLVSIASEPIEMGQILASAELWTKWTTDSLNLDTFATIEISKTRWLRKFEIREGSLREIPLGENEMPLDPNDPLPIQGCNLEFTRISVAGEKSETLTLGLESFGCHGDVERNLRLTVDRLAFGGIPDLRSGKQLSYPGWIRSRTPAGLR